MHLRAKTRRGSSHYIMRSVMQHGDMVMPYKGERDAILAKPAVPFARVLKENAEKLGFTYGDYLVALAAQALDMPQYTPPSRHRREDQLDIPQEASTRAA